MQWWPLLKILAKGLSRCTSNLEIFKSEGFLVSGKLKGYSTLPNCKTNNCTDHITSTS